MIKKFNITPDWISGFTQSDGSRLRLVINFTNIKNRSSNHEKKNSFCAVCDDTIGSAHNTDKINNFPFAIVGHNITT